MTTIKKIAGLFVFIFWGCNTTKPSVGNITLPLINRGIPHIVVQNDTNKVRLSDLNIHVEVSQNVVTTTMDMTFYNPSNIILSGELYFPLGENESVSGMMMEVNGKLREAVPVEKAKGRATYEAVVRKKVDPALAELTKGNIFKTQVYPIPAKGYKRVIIKYQSQLLKIENALVVQIPLQFKEKMRHFDLVVEVLQNSASPQFLENDLANFQFKEWQNILRAEKHEKNYTPNHNISFAYPVEVGQNFVLTQNKNEEETYFHASIYRDELNSIKKISPKKILLYWDASLSGKNRNIKKEKDLILAHLNATGANEIKIVSFANTIVAEKSFAGSAIAEIETYLKSIDYDGATNISSMPFNAPGFDQIILCSDGIQTWGKNEPVTGNIPVYSISSASGTDYLLLKKWCEATGGSFINLENTLPEKALKQLQIIPFHFMGFDITGGEANEIFATEPQGNKLSICGIMKGNSCSLNLKFGYGKEVVLTLPVEIENDDDNKNTGRLWAMGKINYLSANYADNKKEITQLGKEYSIVTKNTSLIILDNLEDYITHGITPPEEFLAEYLKRTKITEAEKQSEIKNHAGQVLTLFNERKEWWNTKFEILKKEKKNMKSEDQGALAIPDSTAVVGRIMYAPVEANEEIITHDLTMTSGFASANNMTFYATADVGSFKQKEEDKSSIEVKKFESNEAYSKELKSWKNDFYNKYLSLRIFYENVPVFYIDAAQLLFDKGMKKEAERVLSNLTEMEVENHELMRACAYKFKEWKEYKTAINLFEEITEMREEEPQSFRDLALAYSLNKQNQKAIEVLYKVVNSQWDSRFPEVEMIALMEINNIVALSKEKLNLNFMDKKLIYHMPCDVRITLEWNYDNSDVDLWVTDPRGEKCFYSHARTEIGGRISKDFTGGYGPEEFLLKKAIDGKYKIEANYYGNSRQKLTGPATVLAKLTTHYGTALEKTESIVVRLKDQSEVVEIGKLSYK